jgi:hypothetical protein
MTCEKAVVCVRGVLPSVAWRPHFLPLIDNQPVPRVGLPKQCAPVGTAGGLYMERTK